MKTNQTIHKICALVSFLLLSALGLQAEDSALNLLPDTFYDVEGKTVSKEKLKGKFVGVYFSASWCPPCRKFTPKLN